jgi:predicted Zn-dependent protease
MTRFWNILAVVAVLATAECTFAHASGFNLYSAQQDEQIGQQSAAQIEQTLPMLYEPASASLVQRIGARLAAQAPGPRFNYRFRVVNLSDMNAFALPGGYVYIHRGLIERVRTEGQLAGVMAHEIAHVALRHQTTNATKATAAQVGAGLLVQLFGGRAGSVLNAVGGLGLNVLFLRFSRTAESEADATGAEIMARAGYDPMDMARFFELMRREAGRDPSRVQVFLSDHPSTVDREAAVVHEARTISYNRMDPVGGLPQAQMALRRLPPAPKLSDVMRAGQ